MNTLYFNGKATYPLQNQAFDSRWSLQSCEDYFQVDHEIDLLSNDRQCVEITFGGEETWIKWQANDKWAVKMLQFMLFYMIGDRSQRVALYKQTDQQSPISKQSMIQNLLDKLQCPNSYIFSPQNSNLYNFIEWLTNLPQYYKQQKSKLNTICTKISQKAELHRKFINYLQGTLTLSHYTLDQYFQNILIPQIKYFDDFNSNSGLGIKLLGVADNLGIKLLTNLINSVGYCITLRKNHENGKQYIRMKMSSDEKEYKRLWTQLKISENESRKKCGIDSLSSLTFYNSTFMKRDEVQDEKEKVDDERESKLGNGLVESVIIDSQDEYQGDEGDQKITEQEEQENKQKLNQQEKSMSFSISNQFSLIISSKKPFKLGKFLKNRRKTETDISSLKSQSNLFSSTLSSSNSSTLIKPPLLHPSKQHPLPKINFTYSSPLVPNPDPKSHNFFLLKKSADLKGVFKL